MSRSSERMLTELANDSSLRRADIARREGLTRARVTQLLALNRISPDAVQQIRQTATAGKRPVSIRVLLGLADGRGVALSAKDAHPSRLAER